MMLKIGTRKLLIGLIGAVSFAVMAASGCSRNQGDTSITNPNPDAFHPVGTIQGVVRDRISQQPIIGATVSIDLKSAKTDAQGSYVIKDVPATADALSGHIVGSYTIEVDLSKAYTKDENGDIDIDMRKSGGVRYPTIKYSQVAVPYTSLNDTECSSSSLNGGGGGAGTCANSSNHDTPVDHLVANQDIGVGKLACNIVGTVYGCDANTAQEAADFATPQVAEVRLNTEDATGNSASGSDGNLLGQVTTDATGAFAFNNVECGGVGMEITAAAPNFDDPQRDDNVSINTPEEDYATLVMGLEHDSQSDPDKSPAVHLCINDGQDPKIIAVSPAPGSDLGATTAQEVSMTFHEPILQTPATSTDPAGVNNLFDNIEVNFDGNKAGNQPFTLSWNATFTTLTVTFDTGASSLYHVRLINIGQLTDTKGNPATLGVCPDDFLAPGAWGITPNGGSDDCTIWFSTNYAGNEPAAPDLTLVNASSLDEGTNVTGIFDWTTSAGSKDYRMYCQKIQVWDAGLATESSQTHPYVGDDGLSPGQEGISQTGTASTVNFDTFEQLDGGTDGIAFVENNEIALHYNCYVVGIDSDGVESTQKSNVELAQDSVGPILIPDGPPSAGALNCPGTGAVNSAGQPTNIGSICNLSTTAGGDGDPTTIDAIALGFNETLRETSLETVGNYALDAMFGAVGIASATGNNANSMVALLLDGPVLPASLTPDSVSGGSDGVVQSTTGGDDVRVRPVCVTEIAGGPVNDETEAGDDIDSTPGLGGGTINVGPNGICETTATTGSQTLPVAQGVANAACIGPGTNTVLESTAAGDDVTVGSRINSGPNGVCETAAAGDDTQLVGVGAGLNTTSITGGPNHVFQGSLNGDDVLTSPTAVTVTGVVDVNNNTIRDTGDEFATDGLTQ